MSIRPVVGLATQTQEPIPGDMPRAWVIGQKYIGALTSSGAVPWLIPLVPEEETLRVIYEELDGVFLPGGLDVNPVEYGDARHEKCGPLDPERDWIETRLVRWAVADGKPVFGVCRGIQMINVACGGSLYQDLAAQRPDFIRHDYFWTAKGYSRDYLAHVVQIDEESKLQQILGVHQLPVNSMHHQGIQRLAPGLRASAFAPDGLIEGFEGIEDKFLLGVQWHPEELVNSDPKMRLLFGAFAEAASNYRAQRHELVAPGGPVA